MRLFIHAPSLPQVRLCYQCTWTAVARTAAELSDAASDAGHLSADVYMLRGICANVVHLPPRLHEGHVPVRRTERAVPQ